MSELADVIFIGVMWAIVLVRGIAMRHTRGHFLMWLALTSGITSISIAQTQLADRITAWAGTPALAFTLDAVLALAAVTWVNTFFIVAAAPHHDPARRRRQWYPWLVTVPVSIALAVLAAGNGLDLDGTYAAVGEHRASVAQILMIFLYEATLLGHLAMMVYLFATLSRRESHIAVRWALRVLTVTSIGVGSRAVYTLATMGLPDPPWPWDENLALQLPMPWYLLGFVAITVLGFVGLAQQRATRRRLDALGPLREALEAVSLRSRSRNPDLSAAQALIARYTEIEDGLRQLREHGTAEALTLAQRYVQAHRVFGKKRRDAIAMAAWIALTLKHLEDQVSLPKAEMSFPHHSARGGNDDIDRLARVAIAFQQHPLVPGFLEACEVHEGTLRVRGLAPAPPPRRVAAG
ncbi:DUF6545 domain-containing protein [Nonomuraea sp. NPDC049695]|uniref:DUF6545 domain-containing protein n=1 Tax=Nonomuraea sp. NPDC049695 TaxID=3154734 RepID=UPI003433D91A